MVRSFEGIQVNVLTVLDVGQWSIGAQDLNVLCLDTPQLADSVGRFTPVVTAI